MQPHSSGSIIDEILLNQISMEYPSNVYYNTYPTMYFKQICRISKPNSLINIKLLHSIHITDIIRCVIQVVYAICFNENAVESVLEIFVIVEQSKLKILIIKGNKYMSMAALILALELLKKVFSQIKQNCQKSEKLQLEQFFKQWEIVSKQYNNIKKDVENLALFINKSVYRSLKRRNIHFKFKSICNLKSQPLPKDLIMRLQTNQQLSELLGLQIDLLHLKKQVRLTLTQQFERKLNYQSNEYEIACQATEKIKYNSYFESLKINTSIKLLYEIPKSEVIFSRIAMHYCSLFLTEDTLIHLCNTLNSSVNILFQVDKEADLCANIGIKNYFSTKNLILAIDRLILFGLIYCKREKELFYGNYTQHNLMQQINHYDIMLNYMNRQLSDQVNEINWKQIVINPPYSLSSLEYI